MARRTRTGIKPSQVLAIATIVVALGGLVAFMLTRSADKFADLTPLPVEDYLENANSLSGNAFRIAGTVSGKLRYTEANGQMLEVEVEHAGRKVDLPVYVPVEFYNRNLNRGDSIDSKVEVRMGGVLSIRDVR